MEDITEKTIIKAMLTLNKWIVFPVCAVYIGCNFITFIDYFYRLYHMVWKFFALIDKLDFFYSWENLSIRFTTDYNDIISPIPVLMMTADVGFSICMDRKPVVKWIVYGIITAVIVFIDFIASPVFYDSVYGW